MKNNSQTIKNDSTEGVVITGASFASPLGFDLKDTAEIWRQGKAVFSKLEGDNLAYSPVNVGGVFPKFDIKELPDRKVKKVLRKKDLVSLYTAIKAFEDAGLKKGDYDPERSGMYVGAGSTQIGDLTPYFSLVKNCADAESGTFSSKKFGEQMHSNVNPTVVLQTLMNNALCFGAMTLDLRGVNANFMDHQVAGMRAVMEGYWSILEGRADKILAGGVSTTIEPFHLSEGVKFGVLAKTRDHEVDVEQTARPYDNERCGTILSEGTGYLVLEKKSDVLKRGTGYYAEIVGCGQAADGFSQFISERDPMTLVRTMEQAFSNSGYSPQDLGFVVGNGSGSNHCDQYELQSYKQAESRLGLSAPIVSVKGRSGDLGEANGIFQSLVAMDGLDQATVFKTYNYSGNDQVKLDQCEITQEQITIKNELAMVNSQNIMGASCSILLKKGNKCLISKNMHS